MVDFVPDLKHQRFRSGHEYAHRDAAVDQEDAVARLVGHEHAPVVEEQLAVTARHGRAAWVLEHKGVREGVGLVDVAAPTAST